MAKASSPQPSGKTKQRIVGTAVLLALFIIIVLILPSRDEEEAEVLQRVEIPPKPDNLSVKVLPIEKPPPPRKLTIPKQPPVTPEQVESNSQTEAKQEPKPEVSAEPVAKPDAPLATANGDHEWVIQVGSFSSVENASALRDRLKADNYKVFVEGDGASSHRVLIGPNVDRAKLEPFKLKLEKLLGAPAIIKAYEPK